MKRISIDLPDSIYSRLQREAFRNHSRPKRIAEKIIAEALLKEGEKVRGERILKRNINP